MIEWKEELKKNITSVEQLKKHIKLSKKEEKNLQKVVKIHPMNITRYYFSLINKKDKNDPIRKLVVPSEEELTSLDGSYDASAEADNVKTVGLQHKYSQTALILSTNVCTNYCRFCYRKRLVGLSNKETMKKFEDIFKYIKKHKEIDNVILSGGDSLTLQTSTLKKFLKSLSSMPHVKYIRFASRIPVVFPDRIIEDKELLSAFKKYSSGSKKIYVITHFNHPREITKKSIKAVKKLIKSGVLVNNQTVLLNGINNDPNILAKLLNKLIEIDVLPYYVFQCRPVKRVKNHFQIPIYKGYKIFEKAKKRIKGHILCKRVKYIMSHKEGKIETIGISGNEMYFKFHQAKNPKNLGKVFKRKLDKNAGWLDNSLKLY